MFLSPHAGSCCNYQDSGTAEDVGVCVEGGAPIIAEQDVEVSDLLALFCVACWQQVARSTPCLHTAPHHTNGCAVYLPGSLCINFITGGNSFCG